MLVSDHQPFQHLLSSLTRAYHRLAAISDTVHGSTGLTAGSRSILLTLYYEGPKTLSQLARHRAVSRQLIQRIASALIDQGLLETSENPSSRRSPMVRLTVSGTKQVNDLIAREMVFVGRLGKHMPHETWQLIQTLLDQLDACSADLLHEMSDQA